VGKKPRSDSPAGFVGFDAADPHARSETLDPLGQRIRILGAKLERLDHAASPSKIGPKRILECPNSDSNTFLSRR
jgi:hypothetical protein